MYIVGSIPEIDDNKKFWNTAIAMDHEGKIVA
jgi:hypothetical protein